jgi:hypothetical protein
MTSNVRNLFLTLIGLSLIVSGAATAQERLTKIPHSEYDRELVGMHQWEVADQSYEKLSFFPHDLRLFVVSKPKVEVAQRSMQDVHRLNAILYAVLLNDGKVIKLSSVSDFAKLNLHIQTEEDALKLVRMFSDFPTGDVTYVRFEGMSFTEVPTDNQCFSIPLDNTLIKPPELLTIRDGAGAKSFAIIRYMFSRYVDFRVDYMTEFNRVLKVVESVAENGVYTQKIEPITMPKFMVENKCGLL